MCHRHREREALTGSATSPAQPKNGHPVPLDAGPRCFACGMRVGEGFLETELVEGDWRFRHAYGVNVGEQEKVRHARVCRSCMERHAGTGYLVV